MDIFKALQEDHREIERLLKLLSKSEDSDEDAVPKREKYFGRLFLLLDAHSRSEEATLYERIVAKDPHATHGLESYEEHKLAKRLLKELTVLPFSSPTWGPKARVLRELIIAHVKSE